MRVNSFVLPAMVATTLGFAAIGCGEDAPSTPQNSYMRSRAAQTTSAQHCDCFTALGFPTAELCRTEISPDAVTAAQATCINGLYVASADTMNSRFLCLEEVHQSFDACMKLISGCEGSAVTACLNTVTTAVAACPALDPSTEASFTACLSTPP